MDNLLTLVSTEPVIDEEKGNLNIKVRIKYTDNIYNELFNNRLKNLLRIISKASKEQYFPNDNIERNKKFDRNPTGELQNAYDPYYCKNPFSDDAFVIYIIENFSRYTAYHLDPDVYKLLYEYFNKNYYYINAISDVIAFDSKNQIIDNNVANKRLNVNFIYYNNRYLQFRPLLYFGEYNNYSKELDINVPLDISVTDIQTKYNHHTVDFIVNFSSQYQ
jgi:hypothetical protein